MDNVHEMNAEVRGSWQMWGKPLEDLLEWFLDESNAPQEILEQSSVESENGLFNRWEEDGAVRVGTLGNEGNSTSNNTSVVPLTDKSQNNTKL